MIVCEVATHVSEVWRNIDTLDLECIERQLIDRDGWSKEQAKFGSIAYRNFLKLVYKYRKEGLVPTKIIDAVWHRHILDTRRYFDDTQSIFGEYLHHNPTNRTKAGSAVEQGVSLTNSLHLQEFGVPLYGAVANSTFELAADCEATCDAGD